MPPSPEIVVAGGVKKSAHRNLILIRFPHAYTPVFEKGLRELAPCSLDHANWLLRHDSLSPGCTSNLRSTAPGPTMLGRLRVPFLHSHHTCTTCIASSPQTSSWLRCTSVECEAIHWQAMGKGLSLFPLRNVGQQPSS